MKHGNRNLWRWLSLCLCNVAFVLVGYSNTTSAGTATVTFTLSGSNITVFSSVGAPPAGYYDRVWVCTQTAAQVAQGFNGIYPIAVTAIPVQRFTDTGGPNTSGTISIATLGAGSRVYAFGGRFQNGTNVQTLNLSLSLYFSDNPQTITVSPPSQAVQIPGSASLTVAGGVNTYTWSATGGALTPVSGGATFTATTAGTYTVSVYANAGSGYSQSNTATATVTMTAAEAQTVVINPTTGTAAVKEISTFTATGGQNGYSFSVSGGGAVSYVGSSASVTWNQPGTWTVKAWSPAGGVYDRSNDATAVITVTGVPESSKKVNLTFDNRTRNYPVLFRVWQDGKVVTERLISGGQILVQTVTVPNDHPVTVTAVLKDPGELEREVVVSTTNPSDTPGPSTPDAPPPPTEPQDPDAEPPAQDEENPSGSPAVPTEASSANRAMVTAAIAAATERAGKASEQGKAVVGKFGDAPSTALQAEPVAPESTSISLGNAGSNISLNILKNPFSSSGPFSGVLNLVAVLIRRLIAWGLVVTFFCWVITELRVMIAAPFNTAPFGNSIAETINSIKILGNGGGWGYAVKLIAFVALFAFMITMPLAIAATVTTGLPWAQLVSTFSMGPQTSTSGSAMLSNAISLANEVVPWAMLMAAPAWYAFVKFVLFPSQLFWMYFIKFLPI